MQIKNIKAYIYITSGDISSYHDIVKIRQTFKMPYGYLRLAAQKRFADILVNIF